MSRTRKDSAKARSTILDLAKREDGTFDIFLNHKLDRSCVSETSLSDELCVRFGFCGEEYDAILQEVQASGRKTIVLWGGKR